MTEVSVEVVYALPDRQLLIAISLPAGSTVADAIKRSNIQASFDGHDLAAMNTGIWGRPVARDHVIEDGDRIEIYRPLEIDPREVRRQRALLGETMRRTNSG